MISQAQINYILALNEYKNFQKAANVCFVTQPTLSMQIKKAEESFGEVIFDRDVSPLSLTDFGKTILPYLHNIMDSYEALEVLYKKRLGTYKAEIRLGIIPTIADYLVPQLYKDWQNKLAGVKLSILELKTEQIINKLVDRKIDMGIMAGPLENPTIESQVLFNEAILIYAPNYKKNEIQLAELEEMHPWLLSEGNCLRTQMINFCNLNEKPQSEWSYEGGSLSLIVQMVQQEGGYTLIPENYLQLLDLPQSHYKKIVNHTPGRQIIAVFGSRNSKKEQLKNIIREIQRLKGKSSLDIKRVEILPWR